MNRARIDTIPMKANQLLHLILIALLVILFRIWQLGVMERDVRLEEVKRPMVKKVFEPAKRGTIRDRFNVPMAINAMNYQAAVVFAAIGDVPAVVYEKDGEGKRVKRLFRREYVEKLAKLLGRELEMDSDHIEDQIWSTASFYGQAPFIIKEALTEKQYYRLKRLSRLWPGIEVRCNSKRRYPHGMVGCDILGYMGAINREEYLVVIHKIQQLQEALRLAHLGSDYTLPEGIESIDQAQEELTHLQERAYSIHDFVGKTGVEKSFEAALRGSIGKKEFESDSKGNFLREILIKSKPPTSGDRLLLTISKDLQEYAEELLAFSEKARDEKPLHARLDLQLVPDMSPPWIKGGAIVAIDPNNGEVLALASYPRFDPNDFIPNNLIKSEKERIQKIHQWLESDLYIGKIFDQKLPLTREFYDVTVNQWEEETLWLSWDNYLKQIYQRKSPGYLAMRSIKSVKDAIEILKSFDALKVKWPSKSPEELLAFMETQAFKPLNQDERLLALNLLRLLIDHERFSDSLTSKLRTLSLDQYRELCCSYFQIKDRAKEEARSTFHELFKEWRKEQGAAFLKEKRLEEKLKSSFAKPFSDYFDEEEKRQFALYWEEKKHQLTSINSFVSTLDPSTQLELIETMRSFDELKRPLIGYFPRLRGKKNQQTEKDLAMAYYPRWGFGYGRSYGYRQSAIQGSIFKVVTAYAGLKSKYEKLEKTKKIITRGDLNTFEIIDQVKNEGGKWEVGRNLDGTVIPQLYKGGRIPRSMNYNLGRVDLVRAIETSSNPFFSLMAAEIIPSPDYFLETMKSLSYGSKTGIALNGEIKGQVPKDLNENKTGLYATAIGQHTLVATPLQTAMMLSTVANGGTLFKPKIAKAAIQQSHLFLYPEEIKNEILMPAPIQELLFTGLKRVMSHCRPEQLYRYYPKYRQWVKSCGDIQKDMVGKTSTSEVLEYQNIGTGNKSFMVSHCWFGGISFEENEKPFDLFVAKDPFGKPELVVVVYMRYGHFGKESVPFAALMAKKWREIKTSLVK